MDPRDLCSWRSFPSLPAPQARGHTVLIVTTHHDKVSSSPFTDSGAQSAWQ